MLNKKSKILLSSMILVFSSFQHAIAEDTPSSLSIHNMSVYLQDRIPSSDKRYASFVLALQLLKQREVKTIVETGTARFGDQNFWGDGGSTIIFGNWAKDNQAKLYTVDISPTAIHNASYASKDYAEAITFACSDSIAYLEKFDKPIDFLYLDSFDFDLNDPLPSQDHHLKEIIAAYPALHEKSIVMIDDCELPYGGKGKLIIEFLVERGWKIFHKGYQVILTQD